MWLHPDLLPTSADSEGSKRYEHVRIIHFIVPCRESKVIMRWCNNMFIIYDSSPDYKQTSVDSFIGTVLHEIDGTYSWWRSIDQRGNDDNE